MAISRLQTSVGITSARTLEQVFGTLFVATLIARLAGIYPPKHESERP